MSLPQQRFGIRLAEEGNVFPGQEPMTTEIMNERNAGKRSVMILALWLAAFSLVSGQLFGQTTTTAAASWQHPAMAKWSGRPVSEVSEAARNGEGNAQYYLAWINWFGERGTTNRDAAVRWFHAAATNNVLEAVFKLGVMAEQGIGRKPDAISALEHYRRAASGSNAVVLLKLARFGGALPPSRTEADIFLKAAANQGYPRAVWILARNLAASSGEVQWNNYFAACMEGAQYGFVLAQTEVATAFLAGKGVEKNRSAAYMWLRLASSARDSDAQRYLKNEGRLFSSAERTAGLAAASDFKAKAMKPEHVHWERLLYHIPDFDHQVNTLLWKSAEAGSIESQAELGLKLSHEAWYEPPPAVPKPIRVVNGVRQEPERRVPTQRETDALHWLNSAASKGHAEACFQAGQRIYHGVGCAPNVDEALRLLLVAAQAGHLEAQHQLASFHQQLNGSRTRLLEAIRWHRQAAAGAHPLSIRWLEALSGGNFLGNGNSLAADGIGLGANVRVAIIVTDAALSEAADLLTATLSRFERIEILERTEIDRILREQAASIAQSAQRIKLGELIGADGLIFMRRFKHDKEHYISVELAAVRPGIIISESVTVWPEADVAAWAQLVAERQMLMLPKLTISKEQAVPISLLNFSSPLLTKDALSLDRQVMEGLKRRLVNYSGVFVLERRRIEHLTAEKSLQQASASFWNGSWILEGEINPDGVRAGMLTIRARLKSPDNEVEEISVTGEHVEFADLIGQLAGRVVELLRVKDLHPMWNPVDEAAQFFDEARWQFAAGVWTEAQVSAEASWALGLRMPELGLLRVSAYAAGLPFHDERYAMGNGIQRGVQRGNVGQVDSAITALEAYQEVLMLFDLAHPEIYRAGVELLTRCLELLEDLHSSNLSQGEVRDRLAILRLGVRKLSAELEKNQASWSASPGISYLRTMMMYAPFCEDTFVDGLKRYDALIRKGDHLGLLKYTRGQLFNLGAWDETSELEQELSWDKQVSAWYADHDPRVEATAAFAVLLRSRSIYESEEARERLAGCFLKNRQAVLDGVLDWELWRVSQFNPYTVSISGSGSQIWESRRGDVQKRLNERVSSLLEQAETAAVDRNNPRRNTVVEVLRSAVRERRSLTPEEERIVSRSGMIEIRHAEQLAPLLQDYHQVVSAESVSLRNLRSRIVFAYRAAGRNLPEGLARPGELSGPKTPVSRKIPPPKAPFVGNPAPRENHPGTSKATLADSAPEGIGEAKTVVNIRELAPVDFDFPSTSEPQKSELLDWGVANGLLWVEARKSFTQYWQNERSVGHQHLEVEALMAINPNSAEIVQAWYLSTNRVASRGLPKPGGISPSKRFAVLSSELYALMEGRLYRAKLPSGALKLVDVEIPLQSKLTVAGNRLFVLAPEAVIEIAAGDAVHVMASTRRRPAQSPLDQLTDLSPITVLAGPHNSIRAVAGNQEYLFTQSAIQWKPGQTLPEKGIVCRKLGDDLLIEAEGSSDTGAPWLSILAPGATRVLPLVQGLGGKEGAWLMPQEVMAQSYAQFSHDRMSLSWAPDGNFLWFAGARLSLKVADQDFVIGYFQPGVRSPALFAANIHESDKKKLGNHDFGLQRQMELFAFKDSLVLLIPGLGRMAIVPRDQFDAHLSSSVGERLRLQKERLGYLQKRISHWRIVFDRNQNGILEPDEEKEMQQSPQVRRDIDEIKQLNAH